jgi:hypothetical protein
MNWFEQAVNDANEQYFAQQQANEERLKMATDILQKAEKFLDADELAYLKWELGL